MYACVAKELEDKSGEYLEDCQVGKISIWAGYAKDMNRAKKLD